MSLKYNGDYFPFAQEVANALAVHGMKFKLFVQPHEALHYAAQNYFPSLAFSGYVTFWCSFFDAREFDVAVLTHRLYYYSGMVRPIE